MIQLQNINTVNPQEIQQLANNYAIAKNMRDVFPFPYSVEDATNFLNLASGGALGHVFGLYFQDDFVGVGSLIPQQDVYRINAEIGYWIGEPYWGKGYATQAVKLLVEHAFNGLNLLRVYARIFDYNTASIRVMEKAGFEKEAVIRSSVIKEDKLYSEHLYSIRKL